MRVLVVGSGGREHALCWKLAQSPLTRALYCAPGNPGTAEVAENVDLAVEDVEGIAGFAAARRIDLTLVGPELPLTLGLADRLATAGLPVFGPRRRASRLEGSKVFAKQFMARHGVPTASFQVVETRAQAAAAAREFGLPVVLKADGLAAGKGVLIPAGEAELAAALDALFEERRFGAAADRVVVEECLAGEEVSMIALADGRRVLAFATSKDYKRIGDGDVGPNTGGMGAHSPSGVIGEDEAERLAVHLLQPVLDGMAREGEPFVGVLYAGLMLTADGPRVLEFNVRFGDPECQPLMLRLTSDLLPVLAAGAAQDFGGARVAFDDGAAVCVVLANAGYPGTPAAGDPITGLEAAAAGGAVVFHAGTRRDAGRLLASGGRVLGVCG
ncbi:MAG: phosphoribosylamine--glycine ligase, partial [Thermoanaerobaculia bacterium]